MKWQLLPLLLICFLPLSLALSIQSGTNLSLMPHCYNESGTFFGTTANLSVWNESEVYFTIASLQNVGAGTFAVNLTNLSSGHCYTLELGCVDVGSVTNEHGTVCVEEERDNSMLGSIILLPLIFSLIMMIGGMLLNKDEHEGLRTGLFVFSFFAFTVSAHFGAIFLGRVYGWVDVSATIVKYVKIIWVLLGMFVLYLAAYHVGSSIAEKRKKKNEQQNY